jgi:hypothetical protein
LLTFNAVSAYFLVPIGIRDVRREAVAVSSGITLSF